MKRICFFCGSEMERKLSSVLTSQNGSYTEIKDLEIYICPKCGEEVYPYATIHKMQEIWNKNKESEDERE